MTAILMFTPIKSVPGGKVLTKLRHLADHSTTEMGAYLGYTRKQVENWEKGDSPIRRAIVMGYAAAAHIDHDEAIDVFVRAIDGRDVDSLMDEWAPWGSNPRPMDYVFGQLEFPALALAG